MGPALRDESDVEARRSERLLSGFMRAIEITLAILHLGATTQNVFLADDRTPDIVNVLRRTSGNLCSDPHDIIYGILGMTDALYKHDSTIVGDLVTELGRAPNILSVAYTRPVGGVFADLVWYIIRRDGFLNVLHLYTDYGADLDGVSTPSWVPDWRFERARHGLLDIYRVHEAWVENGLDVWLARRDIGSVPLTGTSYSLSTLCLSLSGRRLAHITSEHAYESEM
jgi:hypothetical protein